MAVRHPHLGHERGCNRIPARIASAHPTLKVEVTILASIESVLQQNLTPEQYRAAVDPAREVLALACAGSGKSRTMAFRIARLIAMGERPQGIVAFTFTDKAAESIKRWVAKALETVGLSPTILGAMYIGTIHSYCQYVLAEMDARRRQFDVLDDNRLKLYLISRYAQLGLDTLRGTRPGTRYFEVIREVASAWKTTNDEMLTIDTIAEHNPDLGCVLRAVRDSLDHDQFIDFSLMIRLVAEALQQSDPGAKRAVARLQHLLVDEYQDVNPAQETLIRELHRLSSTLFAVGDDDQAIYAWRGADVTNILTFDRRYPGCSVHTLPCNFRSTPVIVSIADSFAAAELGAQRIRKRPTAIEPQGARDVRRVWFQTREEEAEWVADRIEGLLGSAYEERDGTVRGLTPGDFAILMRSTRSSEPNGVPRHAPFTAALSRRHIPYSLEAGGGVFDRPQVRALHATFELLRHSSPDRVAAQNHFDSVVLPAFPAADFDAFARVLGEWGRLIHAPTDGTRRRVYPQRLVHDLLNAFGIRRHPLDVGSMRDLGVFSRIIQDVETVYLSIDTAERFREVLNFLANVAESGYDSSTDEVLRRPDAVTVSTVHKVKGLEFPVVFVVDVEAGRFPASVHRYEGWLPAAVMQQALERGAYQNTHAEEARLFYTAITRAERYLYVSGAAQLPGGHKLWRVSPFAQRLSHSEVSDDPSGMPAGLSRSQQVPRIDETVVPTSFSEVRYYLRCPRDYQFRKGFGFSPPIPELFGFGKTVHTSIGKLHEMYTDRAPSADEAEEIARSVFHLKHVPQSLDPDGRPGAYERARDSAVRIARAYASAYADDFARRRQVEVRFEIPARQAVITGAIDLLLTEANDGTVLDASVIDFKAMEGGETPEEEEPLDWTELALQVQLYALAAREVLGERARTGSVHLLRNNRRVDVPVGEEAVSDAVANIEWAVDRVLAGDFPMRPHANKCDTCDFRALCPATPQSFEASSEPPAVHLPGGRRQKVRAFSQFDETFHGR